MADLPGDLYVLLKVTEHPIFDRENDDLHCTVPINVAQAALGTEVDILTFDGLQNVKIPEGTQKGVTNQVEGLGSSACTRPWPRRSLRQHRREECRRN